MVRDDFSEKQEKRKDYRNGTYLMVPTTDENLRFFGNVERKTKELLRKRFKINVTSDWEIYTISITTIHSACILLASKMRSNFWEPDSVEFYDMLTVGSSNRKNNKAEKTNNINCIFVAGDAIEKISSDPDNFWNQPQMRAADAFLPDSQDPEFPWNWKELRAIAKNAAYMLSYNHGISVAERDLAIILATAYVFLENCYKQLIIDTVSREDKLITKVTYELGTLIRLNGRESDNQTITIELTPGPGAKKIIKDDLNEGESTEDFN